MKRQTGQKLGEKFDEKSNGPCCHHCEGKWSWRMVLLREKLHKNSGPSTDPDRERNFFEEIPVEHWGMEVVFSWPGLNRTKSWRICVPGSCRNTHCVVWLESWVTAFADLLDFVLSQERVLPKDRTVTHECNKCHS